MEDQNHPSTEITWRIAQFTRLTERLLDSDVFTVGGTKWKLKIYPKGETSTEHLAVYLEVADSKTLPSGWSREAKMCLTLVNQLNRSLSGENDWTNFTSEATSWGCSKFIPLSELQDNLRGFLVDEAMVLEAKVEVRRVQPPISITSTLHLTPSEVAKSTERFDTYFASLKEFINSNTTSIIRAYLNSQKNLHLNSMIPSSEDVEQAKQSLKECLSDLCKLNMKRLAKALLTLCLAQDESSSDQQEAFMLFWANFDDFTSDLTCEQDNSKYQLQKSLKNELFTAIKKNHGRHLLIRQSHSKLCKEEEELKKRLAEITSERNNLSAEWESLLVESEMLQSNYEIQGKKLLTLMKRKGFLEK